LITGWTRRYRWTATVPAAPPLRRNCNRRARDERCADRKKDDR
jgi:hypothetical protein